MYVMVNFAFSKEKGLALELFRPAGLGYDEEVRVDCTKKVYDRCPGEVEVLNQMYGRLYNLCLQKQLMTPAAQAVFTAHSYCLQNLEQSINSLHQELSERISKSEVIKNQLDIIKGEEVVRFGYVDYRYVQEYGESEMRPFPWDIRLMLGPIKEELPCNISLVVCDKLGNPIHLRQKSVELLNDMCISQIQDFRQDRNNLYSALSKYVKSHFQKNISVKMLMKLKSELSKGSPKQGNAKFFIDSILRKIECLAGDLGPDQKITLAEFKRQSIEQKRLRKTLAKHSGYELA